MKKLVLLCLSLLASATFAHATITINLSGGNLYTTNTSTFAPAGSLVQLLVSTTDTTFAAPVDGSFTGNSADDFVLASFSLNNILGPGTFQQVIIFALNAFPNLSVGDSLLLRWFPGLSGTAPPSAPTVGNMYGQFRVDIAQPLSTIAWFVPADGSTNDLNFYTMAVGGPDQNPEIAGLANMVVLIPEPSTVALLGISVVGLAAYSRRRKV